MPAPASDEPLPAGLVPAVAVPLPSIETLDMPRIDMSKAPPGCTVTIADGKPWIPRKLKRPVLSILIPTLVSRSTLLARLLAVLQPQVNAVRGAVEIKTLTDSGQNTTGTKRRQMSAEAVGDYIAFVDDDDLVSEDYVARILSAIQQGRPDCVTFGVRQYFDGHLEGAAVCSLAAGGDHNDIDHRGWQQFWRRPNHICAVKRELVVAAGFPDITLGEDAIHAAMLQPMLKTEVHIPTFLYDYLYYHKKPQ
jgi:hypothetical protein